jgi:hypothetical protein
MHVRGWTFFSGSKRPRAGCQGAWLGETVNALRPPTWSCRSEWRGPMSMAGDHGGAIAAGTVG